MRNRLLGCFGLGALALTAFGSASLVSAQTVGYWRFESGAFLADSSGNGFNLSATSSAWGDAPSATTTQYALGESGAGSSYPRAFTGVGANNGAAQGGATGASFSGNYFRVTDKPEFTFTNGFTIEAFITPSTASGTGRTIAGQGAGLKDGGWFFGFNNANQLILQFSRDAGDWGAVLSNQGTGSDYTFQANHDYFVAMSMSINPGVSYQITFFIQDLTEGGDLVSINRSGSGSSIALYDTAAALTIGGSAVGVFSGVIDEVRLSAGALTAEQLLIASATAIPEPSSYAVIAGVLAGFVVLRRPAGRRRSA
jgi:hypothetical protein